MKEYTPTTDPNVFIASQTSTSVVYFAKDKGWWWRIDGVCSQCGECWRGMTNSKPALDCPVTPEFVKKIPKCTLNGEYLDYL